jgi:hypothetical protein
MSSESEVRSRYLALALDARKVIDYLITFVDKDRREDSLDQSLLDVIVSLEAVTENTDIFSPSRNRLAFSEYYEQVRTVQEALPLPDERVQIVQKLRTVEANKATAEKQKEDAFDAILLLSAIESRALYYYRPQP